MFRDLKHHLGLTACQHRSLMAVTGHIACVMMAYVCLQLVRQELQHAVTAHQEATMTIGDVKKHLQSQLIIAPTSHADQAVLPMRIGQFRPMPREVFEQLTDPSTSTVISPTGILMLSSPLSKELRQNA